MFTQSFVAFLSEASFTKDILAAGATQIRKANYATKGYYLQAFSNLSIGLERIGKLCLVIDFAISNQGALPDEQYLKSIGHDLIIIYKKGMQICSERSLELDYLSNLDSVEHQTILKVLSDYAKGDRYSNLNKLTGTISANPTKTWFERVDKPIFEKYVSERKKRSINQNSTRVGQIAENFAYVLYILEDDTLVQTVREASYWTGFLEAVAPHRQLLVIQIIRFWVEVLNDLALKASGLIQVPHFSEIFALFNNPDKYIKTRKTWDRSR